MSILQDFCIAAAFIDMSIGERCMDPRFAHANL